MKLERDYFGKIISYSYMGYDFLTLEDAERLRKFHYQNNAHKEYYDIKQVIWPIGFPKFVDIETSLKTGLLNWHRRESIDLASPNKEESMY